MRRSGFENKEGPGTRGTSRSVSVKAKSSSRRVTSGRGGSYLLCLFKISIVTNLKTFSESYPWPLLKALGTCMALFIMRYLHSYCQWGVLHGTWVHNFSLGLTRRKSLGVPKSAHVCSCALQVTADARSSCS